MKKRILVNPPETEKVYEKLKFSQAVQVGVAVWVSGPVGMDDPGLAFPRLLVEIKATAVIGSGAG